MPAKTLKKIEGSDEQNRLSVQTGFSGKGLGAHEQDDLLGLPSVCFTVCRSPRSIQWRKLYRIFKADYRRE